jgi:hypothetical protein
VYIKKHHDNPLTNEMMIYLMDGNYKRFLQLYNKNAEAWLLNILIPKNPSGVYERAFCTQVEKILHRLQETGFDIPFKIMFDDIMNPTPEMLRLKTLIN